MEKIIVRFAPSPTGYLHIGGARTAIFNWLYARKHGGKFILRIEDTDTERSNSDAIQGILDGLNWLGIDWDEGPYFQSRFLAEHRKAAHQLLTKRRAFKCFCSKEELDAKRETARKNKTTYQYDGTCRRLSAGEAVEKEAAGFPYTIRFKVPHTSGHVIFEDVVHGKIEKTYRDIEDFIIVRANGQPLYVLSNAVDDIRDSVSHVIRGQDGLSNTPKQILIYNALDAPLPKFVHMSLTLDPKKAKISKRKHGKQVAVHYYRDHGFLPWAMVNFLVRLGWSTTDAKELFSKQELIKAFHLEGIGRTNSVFNIAADGGKHFTDPKLMNMNSHYLRSMPLADLAPFVKIRLEKAGLWDPDFEGDRQAWFMQILELIRGRYQLLSDFVTYGQAYFSDDFPMDETAVGKHLMKDDTVAQWMPDLAERLARLSNFDAKTVEVELRRHLEAYQLKTGQLMGAVRTAVTGQGVGPDFMHVLTALGRERVVARLKAAVAKVRD